MSINSAMLAGVSGLVANSSALAAISDNIANVNTTAYKRNQVNFANMVTSQAIAGRYSAGTAGRLAPDRTADRGPGHMRDSACTWRSRAPRTPSPRSAGPCSSGRPDRSDSDRTDGRG